MKPETRALISTISTATALPVNSTHSVTSRATGMATVTAGGGTSTSGGV